MASQYYQATNPALEEHFRQKCLASTDPTVAKIEAAVKQWGAMSAEERMRSFSRFAMDAGLAHTAADIHVNTGLSFLNSFGATASEGLSRLLNSFPPALQPVAAGELAIPVPVGVEVVSWTPVAVGDSAAGFIKAAHKGSLALRSFSPETNRSGGESGKKKAVSEPTKIKGFSDRYIKREHIFSPDHIENGIYTLSDLPEAKEINQLQQLKKLKELAANDRKVGTMKQDVENDILGKFLNIIKQFDKDGAFREKLNVIRTAINGIKIEIHVYIVDGTVIGMDGYLGHSDRQWAGCNVLYQ